MIIFLGILALVLVAFAAAFVSGLVEQNRLDRLYRQTRKESDEWLKSFRVEVERLELRDKEIQLNEALLILKTRRCANCANLILDTVPGYCLDECNPEDCGDFLNKWRVIYKGGSNG
jgi:hypothetical protein